VPNPLKKLLAAALDGGVTPEEIGCQLEAVAVGRLVVEERKGLIQRVEPALLEEFCRMEPIVCGQLHRLHGLVDKVADQVRMEFAYDGGGMGKGGDVTLYYDGKEVGKGRVDQTQGFIFSTDETTDVGYLGELDRSRVGHLVDVRVCPQRLDQAHQLVHLR
jgi:hypothetical protein